MRRLIYLQLRHDLLEGRLPLPHSSLLQLTALTLQAEFGDYSGKVLLKIFLNFFVLILEIFENKIGDIISLIF